MIHKHGLLLVVSFVVLFVIYACNCQIIIHFQPNCIMSIDHAPNLLSDPSIESLTGLLELINDPQQLLNSILLPSSESNKEHFEDVKSLHSISKILFAKLEKLASLHERIEGSETLGMDGHADDNDDEDCPLSGLPELYVGQINNKSEDNAVEEEYNVDSETIFNQVDIQTTAALTKVKRSVRKLGKKIEKNNNEANELVRLLNMEDMEDMNEEDDGDENIPEDIDNNDSTGEEDSNEESESEDEDSRRIRERMERSMAEMGNFSEDEEDESADEAASKSVKNVEPKEAEAIDAAREDLYDGFFDLHEMENFADEEEEMLPDDAYAEPEGDNEESLENKKKMLPHLQGRKGEEDDDDDEDDDEFNELENKVDVSVRRKRYRDDEDINALSNMYEEADDFEDEEDEDEDVINMAAADFFGPPKKPSKAFIEKSTKDTKKVTFDDDDSWNDHDFSNNEDNNWRDADDDNDDGAGNAINPNVTNDEVMNEDEGNKVDSNETEKKVSNYAARNTKLEKMTEELEKDMLAEKPWHMIGEAKSTQRPTNSLLEVTPTFEVASKIAPIITAEHTESIEEMIKRRILAEDWDDVIPRELPDIGLSKRNGELPEVSQEKSKLSLGELYEREYLKKTTGYDVNAVEKETEEEKVKNEMKMLFANLCSKLDALSNYHFAPRPVSDEAEVKTTATPAVAMEEVLPLHVSDAQAMAPEEVFDKKKGREAITRGESEMDQVKSIPLDYILLFVPTKPNQCLVYVLIRLIENDCASLRRRQDESLGKLNLQMKNLFHDFNLSWDSTIHTRSVRCVRSYRWQELVEELLRAKLTTILIIKQVLNFSKRCNLMFRCL